MRFTGTIAVPRLNLRAYMAALEQEMTERIKEAAARWLDATANAIIPVWSGASRATFLHLARAVSFNLSVGVASTAPDRRSLGQRQSDGGLRIDARKGVFQFFYQTTLEHLIHNESNAPTGDPRVRGTLKNPGPYNFQKAGERAFQDFAAQVRLPDPFRFLTAQRFSV